MISGILRGRPGMVPLVRWPLRPGSADAEQENTSEDCLIIVWTGENLFQGGQASWRC